MKARISVRAGLICAVVGICAAPPLAFAADSAASIAGIWKSTQALTLQAGPNATFHTADGQIVPLRSKFAAVVRQHLAGKNGGMPFLTNTQLCVTEGMPSVAMPSLEHPIDIVVSPEQVTVLSEAFRMYRIVRIGVPHAVVLYPAFLGDAIGHWEGDTLVAETVNITTDTHILDVIPHSDKLRVVERIRRTGPDTLEDRVTINDPETFTKAWTLVIQMKTSGRQLEDFTCQPMIAAR